MLGATGTEELTGSVNKLLFVVTTSLLPPQRQFLTMRGLASNGR